MESVVRIADAVSSGRARAADVFAEHVARHRETAGGLNALVQPRHEEGLAEAASLDAASASDPGAPATAAGRERAGGLLAGVPVSVKDCFPVAGLSTTVGIRSRRGRVDGGDAWIVRRLRAAGAIVVGKSNVPQAMGMHETDNPVWGLTRNPFNAERGPGGSSGGDAALVAAGVVPLGVGSDLAGSIRQPAHACGIAGIVPRSASLGDGGGLDTMPHLAVVRPRVGFLARRVADLGRALSAVGASAAADPAGKGGGRPPLRIAFWDDAGPVGPSAAVRRGVAEAVERLRADGLAVERIDGALSVDAAWAHLGILSADGGADLRRLFNGERPMPELARLLRLAGLPRPLRAPLSGLARLLGRSIEADALLATGPRRGPAFDALLALRSDVAARVAAVAAGHDAIVCPVSALPALRHGTAARLVVAAAPCLLANLLDLPAGAVPVTTVRHDEEDGRPASFDPVLRLAAAADRGSRGLPVGVQVVGLDAQPGRGEAVVLEVMRLIERGGVS